MRIHLHIGHGKTGTSAIQSFCALNRELLAEAGFDYPAHRSDPLAVAGSVTSGNIRITDDWPAVIRAACAGTACGNVVFSNEGLFSAMEEDLAPVRALASEHDLRLLLYVRDPVEHFVSSYGQSVKRAGYTGDIRSFIDVYQVPRRVDAFCTACAAAGLDLTVRNYSRERRELLPGFLMFLAGDRAADLWARATPLPRGTVNRSLTAAEHELQRAFNRVLGCASAAFVADPLVEHLPELPVDPEGLDDATLAALIAHLEPAVAAANRHLEPAHRLVIDPGQARRADPSAGHTFTADQLRVLAESVGARIAGAGDRALDPEHAASLVRLALRIERQASLDWRDAAELLRIARTGHEDPGFVDFKLADLQRRFGEA
jgi:hypothetical protein